MKQEKIYIIILINYLKEQLKVADEGTFLSNQDNNRYY